LPILEQCRTDRGCVRAGFGWDSCDKGNWYKQVQDKIPEIKEAGFTHVWLPPPSESVAKQVRPSHVTWT
jgi:glycosidase